MKMNGMTIASFFPSLVFYCCRAFHSHLDWLVHLCFRSMFRHLFHFRLSLEHHQLFLLNFHSMKYFLFLLRYPFHFQRRRSFLWFLCPRIKKNKNVALVSAKLCDRCTTATQTDRKFKGFLILFFLNKISYYNEISATTRPTTMPIYN